MFFYDDEKFPDEPNLDDDDTLKNSSTSSDKGGEDTGEGGEDTEEDTEESVEDTEEDTEESVDDPEEGGTEEGTDTSSNNTRNNRKPKEKKTEGGDGKPSPESPTNTGTENGGLKEDTVRDDLSKINDNKNKTPEEKTTDMPEQPSPDHSTNTGTENTIQNSGNQTPGSQPSPTNTATGTVGETAGTAETVGAAETAGAAGTVGTAETAGAAGTVGAAETAGAAGTAGAGAAGGAAAGGAAAGLAYVLFWVAIVIIAIIIIVGLIMFFITLPGQITGKLKEHANTLMNLMQKFVTKTLKGEENFVKGEEIAEVAAYIENMGYDLKGEGFVTEDQKNDEKESPPEGQYFDQEQGVYRFDKDGNISRIESNPIRVYLVSNNLSYIIKNFNTNLNEASNNHGKEWVLTAIVGCLFSPAVGIAFLVGTAFVAASSNPDWGTGLITIYHEAVETVKENDKEVKKGIIGKTDGYYSSWERGYIELDAETKKLKVKRGWTNEPYTFDIDGWSGRYGMPLEFLLSVHIATKMPDLAVEIATTFDTDVQVLLHEVNNGTMTAGVKVENNKYVDWNTIKTILEDDNNDFENMWNGIVDACDNDLFSLWKEDEYLALSYTDRAYYRLFEEKLPHADSCDCCSHIPGSKASYDDDETSECEDTDELDPDESMNCDGKNVRDGKDGTNHHYICDDCRDNIKKITAALQIMQDNHYDSYTPYIGRVTDHWFRDVYFVVEDPLNTDLIKIDEDYFYETGERWTMYETYTDEDKKNNSIPEGFEVGDYKLYEPEELERAKKAKDKPQPSTKTKAEVEEINEKILNGDTSVTRLVKKPITEEIVDSDGNKVSGRWTAYVEVEDKDTKETGWLSLEVTKDSPEVLREDAIKDILYFKEYRPNDIKQTEDGYRGVTNSKIKEMFLNKKYYKYDGTIATADEIAEDKKNTNRANDNTSNDERNPELISKVSLVQDSLAAFSILENTHTLDADYIYRDFKELIVELDYFDKEDLSDKIQKVMQWPLPESSAKAWPDRRYEKGETFYGTLIHSSKDLELLREDYDSKNSANTTEDEVLFQGYQPNQLVVAPITGKITEFGSVNRQNVDTGKWEIVDFIKIEAIHNYLYDTVSPKGEAYKSCTDINDSFEDKATSEAKNLEGYDYFYEEYQGVLDGFVLYIEGFKLTLLDDDGNITSIDSKYKPNLVHNMTDDLREARAIWKEEAKNTALPVYETTDEDGEKVIYVKEGTVLGTTTSDKAVTSGNVSSGNYMRLILRDHEDAIVEDIENYMMVDSPLEVDWNFLYWLPYESGGMDGNGNGAAACGTVSDENEMALGFAQWTTLVKYKDDGSYDSEHSWSRFNELFKFLINKDPELCSELSTFVSYSPLQMKENFDDIKAAWSAIAHSDAEKFLEYQIDYFYEDYLKMVEGNKWLLDTSLVTQGTYASLRNWAGNPEWLQTALNNAKGKSDLEICEILLRAACPIGSTCGTLESRWESQFVLAKDIINGTFTEVEEWVRTKRPNTYGEGKNSGSLL